MVDQTAQHHRIDTGIGKGQLFNVACNENGFREPRSPSLKKVETQIHTLGLISSLAQEISENPSPASKIDDV